MKPDKISTGSYDLKIRRPKFAIGRKSSNFFRLIVGKYDILHYSVNLPALIFRKSSGSATNNSLHCRPYNSYINVHNSGSSTIKFQEILKYFSCPAVSSYDFSTCSKKRASTECRIPVCTYSGVNRYLNSLLTGGINDTKSRLTNGKTDFNSGLKSWFINDMRHEKTKSGQLEEVKARFTQVLNNPLPHTRNIPIMVNPMVLSKIWKTFNFESSGSEHYTVTQSKDITSRPFANPAILDNERGSDSKNAGSKSNLMVPAVKKVDTPSAEKFVTSQRTDPPPLLQTRTLIMTLVNPATLKYLRLVFNLKASQVENEKGFSGRKIVDKVSTFESTTPLTIESLMFQRIRNKQDLQYGYFFNFDIKPTGRNLVSAFQNRGISRGSSDPFQDNVVPYPRPDFEYAHRFVKNNRLHEIDEDTVSDSRELVLRKTSPEKIKTISENSREIQTEEISSSRTYGDLAKEPVKEKQIQEIDIIADKVYKIIERRISIEKDRRGLF